MGKGCTRRATHTKASLAISGNCRTGTAMPTTCWLSGVHAPTRLQLGHGKERLGTRQSDNPKAIQTCRFLPIDSGLSLEKGDATNKLAVRGAWSNPLPTSPRGGRLGTRQAETPNTIQARRL